MLEQLLNLKQEMKENKWKVFVYEKFQDYFFWYESLENRGVKEKQEFREVEEEYLKYMNKKEFPYCMKEQTGNRMVEWTFSTKLIISCYRSNVSVNLQIKQKNGGWGE